MPTGIWLWGCIGLECFQLLIGVVLIAVVRQVGTLHQYWADTPDSAESGLPLGGMAPEFADLDVFGHPVSLAHKRSRKTFLLFLSTHCSGCREAMAVVPSLCGLDGARRFAWATPCTGLLMGGCTHAEGSCAGDPAGGGCSGERFCPPDECQSSLDDPCKPGGLFPYLCACWYCCCSGIEWICGMCSPNSSCTSICDCKSVVGSC